MKEQRIIIKTDDGRYIKAGTDCASEFTIVKVEINEVETIPYK